ncbi:MAG: DUF6351 family protein [Nevskia sp.]|nr:DUF6351 family protein [Nevskia sp.]
MQTKMRRVSVLAFALLVAACGGGSSGGGGPGGNSNASGSNSPTIKVLSNRADLINGGDALVEVDPPSGTAASALRVSLNGQDISAQFAASGGGQYMALVSGLTVGSNTLSAQAPGLAVSSVTIVNHPQGGPVFAGPQIQPWTCQQGAVDAQCNQAPVYTWMYKSSDPLKRGLQPYDPAKPAIDVARTTTDQGVAVPFIVRVETGYQDRDQYQIAVLFQPKQAWTALKPQQQFNHKLVIDHGASCGAQYETGTAPSTTSYQPLGLGGLAIGADSAVYALGAGFAVMSTALDNSGHDCNLAVQAESLIMAKEHLIESYGTLRYTIGQGCSGGSLAQQWIANAYPGVYQGILPTCSFPDAVSSAVQVAEYHMLIGYFGRLSAAQQLLWTEEKRSAVEGAASTINAVVSDKGFFYALVPTSLCGGVSSQQLYNPTTNPGGVRCSVVDYDINIFGPRPPGVWTAPEKQIGHGFGGLAADNVGVQYGLQALQKQQITPAEFVDLNANIGGLDVDMNHITQRLVADEPALANAYRSGSINETNNLDRTAIIDCRGPNPCLAHDSYRAFAVRARLDREHGSHANQLIWEGPSVIVGDADCNLNSLAAMDRWLAAIEADTGTATLAQKVVNDKPADLSDACWDGNGNKLSSQLCGPAVVPVYGTPRMVAGEDVATDISKCTLKPLDRSDNYGPAAFTDAQWTQLQGIFPDGVCDFTQPGVQQQATIAWQTYQDGTGAVIYGGQAMPAAPANSGGGWASPAFGVFAQ